jgi:hypothetical protein
MDANERQNKMTVHKKVSKPARLNVVRAGKGAETHDSMGFGGSLIGLHYYCAAGLRISTPVAGS